MERLPVMYIYCSSLLKFILYSCTCSCGRIIKIKYLCVLNVLGSWLAMWGINPGRVWLAMQFWGDGCCSKAGEAWYHYKSEFSHLFFSYFHFVKACGWFLYSLPILIMKSAFHPGFYWKNLLCSSKACQWDHRCYHGRAGYESKAKLASLIWTRLSCCKFLP